MRAWVGAACAAGIVAACAGSGGGHDERAGMSTCTPGARIACTDAGGRAGTKACAATGDGYLACLAAACGGVPVTARGALYTTVATVPLAGATTTIALEAAAAAGGGACVSHAVLSADAGGCRLEVELGAGQAPYGGVRAVALTVGPACPGFTAAQEGIYLSPPGWAPGWWLGPTSLDPGVSCVPDAVFSFPGRPLRLTRADGASLDVDLRDVVFAGDLGVAPGASPLLACPTLACAPGMRDGGAGWCAPEGSCAKGFHDDGAGACTLEGTCARGYGLDPAGACTGWLSTGAMVHGRRHAAAFRLPDGDVLVTGGYTCGSLPHDPIRSERYRPTTRTWSETGTPAHKHEEAGYAQLATGRVLATGGFATERGGAYDPGGTSVAEVYDPAAGAWATVAPMIAPRYDHAAVTLKDGRVLVVGGRSDARTILASAEVFDPATGAWTATGNLAVARESPAAALLPDGRVLVAGGLGTFDAEVWDPATGAFAGVPGTFEARTLAPLADGRLLMTSSRDGVVLVDPRTLAASPLGASGSWVVPLGGRWVLAGTTTWDRAALVDVDARAATPLAGAPRDGAEPAALLLDGTVLFVGGGERCDGASLYVGRP